MNREQIIEAMADELRSYESCKHSAEYGGCVFTNCACEHKAKTLISRLGDFIPGLADVISGMAVIAPVEHASDCSVHNEPAYPAGPCDCGRHLTRDDEQAFAKALIASSKAVEP